MPTEARMQRACSSRDRSDPSSSWSCAARVCVCVDYTAGRTGPLRPPPAGDPLQPLSYRLPATIHVLPCAAGGALHEPAPSPEPTRLRSPHTRTRTPTTTYLYIHT